MTQSALMHKAIQSIAVGPDRGRDISQTDAEQIMGAILQGNIDPIQTAVFLIALRMKRESLVEFRGLFQGLQSEVEQVTAEVDSLTCLADPFDGYVRHIPMSPFLPAVLSACGMSVLMHGVETVGPKHGVTAHKVYKLAGLPTLENAHSAAKSIQQHGWGYLDQSQYLPSLYALLPLRDKIIKRTAITTLERLLMPVRGRDKTHMVLGYVHKAYPEIYAEVAEQAGYDTVLLVKGVEGGLTPGLSKPLRRFFTDCRQNNTEKLQKELVDEHNAQQADTNAVAATTTGEAAVAACLQQGLNVLDGQPSTARDSLVLAAANILATHKLSCSFENAVTNVKICLDNGKARENFLNLQKT